MEKQGAGHYGLTLENMMRAKQYRSTGVPSHLYGLSNTLIRRSISRTAKKVYERNCTHRDVNGLIYMAELEIRGIGAILIKYAESAGYGVVFQVTDVEFTHYFSVLS